MMQTYFMYAPGGATTPRLEQEFRYDIQWPTHNNGVTTDNYGVSKGLELIPQKNTEVILAIPPHIGNNPDSPRTDVATGRRELPSRRTVSRRTFLRAYLVPA
jgi:hypothetical protein